MEDNNITDSPDNSVNHSKTNKKLKSLIFVVIALLLLICIVISIIVIVNKNRINLKKQVFSLSDNSTLMFIDNENYILNYKILNNEFTMKGKYKISFDDDIDENIKYEYGIYIDKLTRKEYKLGFLELQNDELYINDNKSVNGYMNTYYILMVYYEDGVLVFNGYNVDTGTKIKFIQQKNKFKEYYNKLEKYC